MRMYKCNSCKAIFDEPQEVIEATGVSADIGAFGKMSEVISYDACPECGNPYFEDAPKCDICGEYAEMHEHMTVCEDCYQDMEGLVAIAFNNFKKLHQDATDDDMYDLLYDIWNEYDEGR